jgi:sugar phosphate isomerase/epimerase
MPERPLSLHQFSALELQPLEFLAVAAAAGADQVSIFTHVPRFGLPDQQSPVAMPVFSPAIGREARLKLADAGLQVGSDEFFPINEHISMDGFAPALALGRELGARRAIAHIHDAEPARAVDRLGALCDLAAGEGLAIGLEFMGLLPACDSLRRAAWFVDQVGRANIGVGVDFLHFVRSGGAVADLAALTPRYFAYAQLCDGRGLHASTDYADEAFNRLLPGEGDFPLEEMCAAIPGATPYEVEAPAVGRKLGRVELAGRLAEALDRARRLIERVRPTR